MDRKEGRTFIPPFPCFHLMILNKKENWEEMILSLFIPFLSSQTKLSNKSTESVLHFESSLKISSRFISFLSLSSFYFVFYASSLKVLRIDSLLLPSPHPLIHDILLSSLFDYEWIIVWNKIRHTMSQRQNVVSSLSHSSLSFPADFSLLLFS